MSHEVLERYRNVLLLLARVFLTLLFIIFGWKKLIGFSGTSARGGGSGHDGVRCGHFNIDGFVDPITFVLSLRVHFRYRVDRPSLLEYGGRRSHGQHDSLLQECQHYGRLSSASLDRGREIFVGWTK
jgi:hypothetical protein